jgi:ERCC4-type nuclease
MHPGGGAVTLRFVVDTREQKPWAAPKHREMERRKLDFGDYSLAGYESRVCVERKSLDDYVGSLFSDWKRFAARLAEMSHLELACVVVEATEEDIRKRKYVPDARSTRRVGRSAAWANRLDKLEPARVLASTAGVYAEFKVPVFLAGAPTRAAAFAFAVLTHWYEREKAKQA